MSLRNRYFLSDWRKNGQEKALLKLETEHKHHHMSSASRLRIIFHFQKSGFFHR